jgi:hypothetical protein
MDYEQSEIRRDIESTRAGMVEKISRLETRIGGAIKEIKRLPDIKYQVEHRTWWMMGLSVVMGYMVSRLIVARPERRKAIVHWPDVGKTERIAVGQRSSLIGGIVSSIGVALARDLVTNLMRKCGTQGRGNSATSETKEPRQLH